MSLALPHQFNTTNSLTIPQLVRPTQTLYYEKPDIKPCSMLFGEVHEGLDYQDCREALDSLPTGGAPVVYRPLRPYGTRNEPPNLIVIKTVGTCQLKAFASGYWAEHAEFAISIIPNYIRDMFEDVIGCLDYAGEGGFVTKHFARTIDWVLAPDAYFPQDPGELYMPQSITFLTAMIRETRVDADFYEPGANSAEITAALMFNLQNAYAKTVREEGSHSLLARKLKQRENFLRRFFYEQGNEALPFWTWWGARRQLALGSNVTLGDSMSGDDGVATKVQSNITSGSVTKNVTVLDFSNDADAVGIQ